MGATDRTRMWWNIWGRHGGGSLYTDDSTSESIPSPPCQGQAQSPRREISPACWLGPVVSIRWESWTRAHGNLAAGASLWRREASTGGGGEVRGSVSMFFLAAQSGPSPMVWMSTSGELTAYGTTPIPLRPPAESLRNGARLSPPPRGKLSAPGLGGRRSGGGPVSHHACSCSRFPRQVVKRHHPIPGTEPKRLDEGHWVQSMMCDTRCRGITSRHSTRSPHLMLSGSAVCRAEEALYGAGAESVLFFTMYVGPHQTMPLLVSQIKVPPADSAQASLAWTAMVMALLADVCGVVGGNRGRPPDQGKPQWVGH